LPALSVIDANSGRQSSCVDREGTTGNITFAGYSVRERIVVATRVVDRDVAKLPDCCNVLSACDRPYRNSIARIGDRTAVVAQNYICAIRPYKCVVSAFARDEKAGPFGIILKRRVDQIFAVSSIYTLFFNRLALDKPTWDAFTLCCPSSLSFQTKFFDNVPNLVLDRSASRVGFGK